METSHIDLNLDAKLGAMFLGNVVAAILYGVTSVQTFIYFKGSAQDLRSLKVIVLILWLLDSLHIILVTHTVYFYTVSNYADPLSLNTPIWSNVSQVYTTCISDLIVRGLFSRRVWLLSGKKHYLVALIACFAIGTAVTGFAFVSRGFEFKSMTALVHVSFWLYIALSFGAIADVIITVSLVTFLLQSRTGFKRTDSLVNILMVFTINTGLLTSMCTMLCLITYAIWPTEYIFMGIHFCLSAMYLNSLLATLNARTSLREWPHGVSTIPLEFDGRGNHSESTKQVAAGVQPSQPALSTVIISVNQHIETISHIEPPRAV